MNHALDDLAAHSTNRHQVRPMGKSILYGMLTLLAVGVLAYLILFVFMLFI